MESTVESMAGALGGGLEGWKAEAGMQVRVATSVSSVATEGMVTAVAVARAAVEVVRVQASQGAAA